MENVVNKFNLLKRTYSGKKVFITGHTGFKGSWMLKLLSMLGADIKGYALDPTTNDDLFCLLHGDKLCKSVIADLRNRESLKDEVLEFQPDFIFHLAAQPLVRQSYDIPAETFEINAIGTANLLDAVRLLNKPCQIVLITTDKVYHNNEWVYPYRENDRLGGYDPYSASKACTELVIDSYVNSFFNKSQFDIHRKAIAVGRAGNVIGGGDWSKDRLIPDIAKALTLGDIISVRNPYSIRPWQHVLEPVVAYLLLGHNLFLNPKSISNAYNFGPYENDALSVEEMLKLAIASWGSGEYRYENSKNQPHEAGVLKLDISKAISELSWRPKLNAKTAVQLTMDWYSNFSKDRISIESFTETQITNYLNV